MTQLNTGLLPVPIPTTGNASNNFSTDHQTYPYRVWKGCAEYIFQSGLTQRGVAMPSAAASSAPSPGSTSTGNLPPGAATPTPAAPAAGPRIACAITQTSAPYMAKIVSFVAERENAQPAVPDPSTTDGNEVMGSWRLKLYSPDTLDDGVGRVYKMEGVYEFLLKTYVTPQDAKFAFPAPPSDTRTIQRAQPSSFKTNIVG